jgi:hypothetical protein
MTALGGCMNRVMVTTAARCPLHRETGALTRSGSSSTFISDTRRTEQMFAIDVYTARKREVVMGSAMPFSRYKTADSSLMEAAGSLLPGLRGAGAIVRPRRPPDGSRGHEDRRAGEGRRTRPGKAVQQSAGRFGNASTGRDITRATRARTTADGICRGGIGWCARQWLPMVPSE